MLGSPDSNKKHDQIQFVSLDEWGPQDHLLRKIDKSIDFNFIYELVAPCSSKNIGRSGLDPVTYI